MINITQDLEAAYLRYLMAEQQAEESAIRRAREYYEGEQGVKLTARQREYLGDAADDVEARTFLNICARAVQIPLERLAIDSIGSEADGSTLADAVMWWWEAGGLEAAQSDIYESALRDATTCVIVGWDGAQNIPTFTQNDLYDGEDGQVRLHYSLDDGALLFASKRYHPFDTERLVQSSKTRLTVYLPDQIIRFEDSAKEASGWRRLTPEEAGGPNPQPWVGADGQPLGIAVIPFSNPGGSELDDILMPQRALNKVLAGELSSEDMAGFPLLVLKGYRAVPGPDGTAASIKLAPGEGITVPSDGDVTRIPPADLSSVMALSDAWIARAAMVKGWPVYLFLRGEPPSGESLKVLESSLINQVKRKQQAFETAWREAFAMGAALHRYFGGQELVGDLAFKWAPPQTRQALTDAQAQATTWQAAEIPRLQRWRELGYSDDDIARMQEEENMQAAQVARSSVMAAIMQQQTLGGVTGGRKQITAAPAVAAEDGTGDSASV